MRSYVPAYEVYTPRNLGDTLQLLAVEPGHWTLLAGGTDVMVMFEAGTLTQRHFLNIWGLRELKGIHVAPDHVDIGALTTYTEAQHHPVLGAEFPNLCEAGRETGGHGIQNRGTIGGNIANASPAADSPPALLVYDAELRLVSTQGERWVPYHSFHLGYKKIAMRPDEVIATIRLPRSRTPVSHFYRKVGTRKAQAISKVVLAGAATVAGGKVSSVRLALGSVAPVTLRCRKTEALLTGQKLTPALIAAATAEIAKEIQPIDDIRSTADYRRQVTGNVLGRFLAELGG